MAAIFLLNSTSLKYPNVSIKASQCCRSVLASPQPQECPLFALDVRLSDLTHARAQDRWRVGGVKLCRFLGVVILSGSPGSNVNPGSSVGVSTRWPLGGPIP